MEIVPESAWDGLFEKIMTHKGTSLIIGATDSGKSTLSRYLIRRLVSENISVSLVDSDVGQSCLSLPGTISMKVFCAMKDLKDFRFEKMFFIGTINPSTKIPFIIDTTKKLTDICKGKSLITLIDTTGLISGEIGRALKIGKIKAVNPEHLIAIQRNDELEHILKQTENLMIHRIKTSIKAKIRSTEERFRYRKKKFEDYFYKKEVSDFLLRTNDTKFYYSGKLLSPKDSICTEGTLIGLNHYEDTLALGIVLDMSTDSVIFRSPIKSLKSINNIVFGDIKI